MGRLRAALGSFVFLLLAPGVVAGLIPWWLTDWEADWTFLPLQAVGFVLIVAGVVVLLNAFARFALEGLGTPAPVAPTEKLVVGAIIFGQALLLGRTVLLAYGLLFFAVVAAFVRWYEEPTLKRQFGEDYDAYKRAVPRWWPRRSAWTPPEPEESTPPRPQEPRPGSDPGHGPW